MCSRVYRSSKTPPAARDFSASPLSETVMAYLVSLAASAFMMFFFQKLSFDDPWSIWLSYTLVLGLPATIGGAAGRLTV
ncbi:DUF2391 family protein [Microcoleus vaginatus]|uniref:DUF2391 family protein n=1 Tax=Microcoleus vaginatus TaxID=119532 RepID=UPI00403F5CCE